MTNNEKKTKRIKQRACAVYLVALHGGGQILELAEQFAAQLLDAVGRAEPRGQALQLGGHTQPHRPVVSGRLAVQIHLCEEEKGSKKR